MCWTGQDKGAAALRSFFSPSSSSVAFRSIFIDGPSSAALLPPLYPISGTDRKDAIPDIGPEI